MTMFGGGLESDCRLHIYPARSAWSGCAATCEKGYSIRDRSIEATFLLVGFLPIFLLHAWVSLVGQKCSNPGCPTKRRAVVPSSNEGAAIV